MNYEKMKRSQIILLSITAILLVAGIAGYRLWNKPAARVDHMAAEQVDAYRLYELYQSDEQKANIQFLGKALQVSGVIAEISQNQDHKTVAILEVADVLGGVQCTFRNDVKISTGMPVTVKGFCNGYTMVVLLNDCILL